jgi:hypothetical protein
MLLMLMEEPPEVGLAADCDAVSIIIGKNTGKLQASVLQITLKAARRHCRGDGKTIE